MNLQMAIYLLAASMIFSMAAADFNIITMTDVQSAQQACITEQNIPRAIAQEYKNMEFPNNDFTDCYIQCLLNKLNLYNTTTGLFEIANVIKQLSHKSSENQEPVKQDLMQCLDQKYGEKACSYPAGSFLCFMQQHIDLVMKSCGMATEA